MPILGRQTALIESPDVQHSLMTPLGVIEGEILIRLEEGGATTLRGLIRQLSWPAHLTTMAAGVLIRAGLARGRQRGHDVALEPLFSE